MARRVVLITGCGSGFGLLTAGTAAKAGFRVYATVRDPDRADDLHAAVAGLPVTVLPLDVTVAEQRRSVVAHIERDEGRLDALVNNAGRALGGFLELVEEDELRAVFEVNLFGPWALTREALPLLRRSAPSTVVMVSSTSGLTAIPGLGTYASTKFALEGLSEAWRHELAPFGVRVVLLEPGAYTTDIFGRNRHLSRGVERPGVYGPYVAGLDHLFQSVVDRIARDPQEVADAIVHALEHRRPPLRMPLGPSSGVRMAIRRVVPFGLVELGMRWALKRARTVGERLEAEDAKTP